jgi:RNA polymerase-binding transcription factor DksA
MNVETQVHLTMLRGLLAFRLRELQADLDALQQVRARPLADVAPAEVTGRQDIAVADPSADTSETRRERLCREVVRCESAQQRLDAERYGDCIDCGESISWPRLLAHPATERCASCQRALERGVVGSGRP